MATRIWNGKAATDGDSIAIWRAVAPVAAHAKLLRKKPKILSLDLSKLSGSDDNRMSLKQVDEELLEEQVEMMLQQELKWVRTSPYVRNGDTYKTDLPFELASI